MAEEIPRARAFLPPPQYLSEENLELIEKSQGKKKPEPYTPELQPVTRKKFSFKTLTPLFKGVKKKPKNDSRNFRNFSKSINRFSKNAVRSASRKKPSKKRGASTSFPSSKFSNYNQRKIIDDYLRRKRLEKKLYQEKSSRLSPNTQAMLDRVRAIQNKGFRDDERQQRIQRERKILESSMNLMKSHENMRRVSIDFTGVNEENILMAPNLFRESPNNSSIMRSNRPSILDTRSTGNNLFF